MRGRLHAYGFFVAVVCGVVMVGVAAARPGVAPLVSTVVYSVTVCALFAVSGLYHRRVWSERGYRMMRRLDHAMIFVFIAGTYTPLCVLLLSQAKATILLTVVWAGALAGVTMSMIWPHAPRWVSAPLYLGLGWAAVVILPDVARVGGTLALVMLALGGLGYSVGAVLFALRRPNPWPAVFGHHEVFHACTVVAATCHHLAIYLALFA
ncbi:PAQR family membrane homeostasis protein TrhA [Catellatospora citrea]|uniref:Membrane protein n=1 Tax=Catellatospora citrea TaxID=53366 RepID=A0A8J3KE33_9ACTN|nr:hemolysin III family protein [Catellatospora citrea]GIF98909.1 membrane protein [Catellatospora citrea]